MKIRYIRISYTRILYHKGSRYSTPCGNSKGRRTCIDKSRSINPYFVKMEGPKVGEKTIGRNIILWFIG